MTPKALFFFEVKVSEDAVGPAALTDGVATAEAVLLEDLAAAPAALPRNFSRSQGIIDVDETDNTDDFTVFVAGPGGQGPLPETGVKVGLIAGAGAATDRPRCAAVRRGPQAPSARLTPPCSQNRTDRVSKDHTVRSAFQIPGESVTR